MGVEDIKHSIAALSANEQNEVSAYLFHLRHASDPGYQDRVSERLADTDMSHWLTPEQTAYLLRSPVNAKRLVDAIHALENGRGKVRKLKPGK